MRGAGLFNDDLVLFDRSTLPSSGRFVVALHEGELIVGRVKGPPSSVSLVATDGMTPPIWFDQGSDPENLGTVIVGVHHLFNCGLLVHLSSDSIDQALPTALLRCKSRHRTLSMRKLKGATDPSASIRRQRPLDMCA